LRLKWHACNSTPLLCFGLPACTAVCFAELIDCTVEKLLAAMWKYAEVLFAHAKQLVDISFSWQTVGMNFFCHGYVSMLSLTSSAISSFGVARVRRVTPCISARRCSQHRSVRSNASNCQKGQLRLMFVMGIPTFQHSNLNAAGDSPEMAACR